MADLPSDHDNLVPHVRKRMGGKAQGMRPHMRLDRKARGVEKMAKASHGKAKGERK